MRGLDPEQGLRRLTELAGDAARLLARRGAGEYREDEWGFDEEYAELVYPVFEFLYDHWWRVEVSGVENVPAHGRAMLAANHAGSIFPFDATMIGVGIMKEHPLPRWTRALVLDWAFELPYAGLFLRKIGGVAANPDNAARLLDQDQLVMVFPEGLKGTRKSFAERYRLARFGRGGFVGTALAAGAPIIPVAVVGSEEIYPKLAESDLLAKLSGAPFFPLTPTFPWLGPLGLLPLPSRWRIHFCPPIDVSANGPEAIEDKALLFDLSEQVRETIQAAVYEALVARGSAFLHP